MRRMHRIVLLVALVALTPVLVGCEGFDNEKFDLFGINDKKKLKGERKDVFPQGVPGVTQGLPPEYLNKQQSTNTQPPPGLPANAPNDNAAAPAQPGKTAAIEPPAEPKPAAKPKRKPKPTVAKHPVTPVTAQPAAPAQSGAQQPASPWPDQKPVQSPPPAQGQNMSTAPWPSAPPPGTFSR